MKALIPTLAALCLAGAALAQEAEPPTAEDTAAEGTDAGEESEPAPSESEPPSPPTSYNPGGAYAPAPSMGLDPQTRLPPTSYNPSGAYTPSYVPPDWRTPTTPVFIDQAGRTPDTPPSYADAAYESRLKSSFLSAQGMKGPLEGGWVIGAATGGELYQLQLVDNQGGYIEGAWRDLRRPGAIDASGLIVSGQRTGSQFNLRFYPKGYGDAVVATLTATADGRWSGELIEAGERRMVTLRRN